MLSISRAEDGYAANEEDEFHWDQFFGSVLLGVVGVVVIGYWRDMSEAPAWLIPGAFGLFGLAVAGGYLSSFWRRYHALLWWKKGIILLSSAAALAVILVFVMAAEFVRQLTRNSQR